MDLWEGVGGDRDPGGVQTVSAFVNRRNGVRHVAWGAAWCFRPYCLAPRPGPHLPPSYALHIVTY